MKFPDHNKTDIKISPEAQDLIKKLLTKDYMQRLGYTNDVDEVLAHPFFRDINLTDLLKKKIKPSFVPEGTLPRLKHKSLKESLVSRGKRDEISKFQKTFQHLTSKD